MQLIRDKAAVKCINVYVVLDSTGQHVATVQAYRAQSGGVTVNVWTPKQGLTYQSRATGYGYDKFAAALAGAKIGCIEMVDQGHDYAPDQAASIDALRDHGYTVIQAI